MAAKKSKHAPSANDETGEAGSFPFDLSDIKLNKNCLPVVLTTRTIDVGNLSEEHCDEIRVLIDILVLHGKEPITLRIDSPGGAVEKSLGLYDYLRFLSEHHKIPIQTLVMGNCYSAAGYLQLAGDVRMAYPNAEFMVHPISQGTMRGTFKSECDMIYDARGLRRLTRKVARLYADRTKKSYKFWLKHLTHTHREIYFSPEKAEKLGLL